MRIQATYYLGRVHKTNIEERKLVDALKNSARIQMRGYAWTLIDVSEHTKADKTEYVYGKLAKYVPRGSVSQVDENFHESKDVEVDRYMVASSHFVYIPCFSGIAHQHVWNRIEHKAFRRTFGQIVQDTLGHFFVECEVEPIVEYTKFIQRISSLRRITRLNARVHLPNPLFGRLWESLKGYLDHRNLDELAIKEEAARDGSIHTELAAILESAANDQPLADGAKRQPLDIGDAAVLMAADGYGVAQVEGREGERKVVIRTRDVTKSFHFDADPEPQKLFEAAREELDKVSRTRHLGHGGAKRE